MNKIYLHVDEDIPFDVDDVLGNIDSEDLIAEIKKRQINSVKTSNKSITDMYGYQIRTYLQDLFDTNHTISDEELLKTIKSYLQ